MSTHRIHHIDTVRGVAMMGILIINSVWFFLNNQAIYNLSEPADQSTFDWCVGALVEVFADQKFMGMFSLLFGASFSLYLERIQNRTAHPLLTSAWRNTLLFVIGVIHGSFWIGDILFLYALCVPFLMLLRSLTWKAQVLIGLTLYYSVISLALWVAPQLDATIFRDVFEGPDTSKSGELLGSYLVFHAYMRALGMMLIGMGLYQCGWLTGVMQRHHRRLATVAASVGVLLGVGGIVLTSQRGYTPAALVTGNIPTTLATPLLSLAYVTLIIAWDARSSSWLLKRIRALGRMALSNYLTQTAICLLLVHQAGIVLLSRSSVWVVIVSIWLIQMVASHAWLRRFRLGPAEWLWRCATDRDLHPIKRS